MALRFMSKYPDIHPSIHRTKDWALVNSGKTKKCQEYSVQPSESFAGPPIWKLQALPLGYAKSAFMNFKVFSFLESMQILGRVWIAWTDKEFIVVNQSRHIQQKRNIS
jgi:hypothetical protein